jgi:hypothetical protein
MDDPYSPHDLSMYVGHASLTRSQKAKMEHPEGWPIRPNCVLSFVTKLSYRGTSSASDSGVFAFGVKTSLLGVGAEIAARVTHRTNVRAGFNILGYSRNFGKDGVTYEAHLAFRTIEAHYDIFPKAGGFHISPGVLAYLGNPITANALIPANKSFTLGGQTYYSDPANSARANGHINFNQVAPTAMIGWGNLVHRDSKRFTVSFEIGAAFQGSPKTTLNLGGNVCDSPGVNCHSAASDSNVHSNIVSEQAKINKSLAPFKVYPIIPLGSGYKVH